METFEQWEKRYPAFTGPYYGFQSMEIALGHACWGLAGHYGAWVRDQVTEEAFRAFSQADILSPAFGGEAYDWHMPLHLHNSVWTAERTIDFLEHRDDAQPFLLSVGFEDPHHPHCVPVEFSERVDPRAVPLPDYTEGELDDKPAHFHEAHIGACEQSPMRGAFWLAGQGPGFDYRRVREEDARLGRAYYYTLVRLIDRQMGRILEALERTGLAENTLVIFTTDHGELLGDHGLWMKGPYHYEPLVRIPLLLRWPRGFPGGQRLAALINQVDLAPTILAAAGAPCPAELDGIDALPLLRGEAPTLRESTLIEFVDDPRTLRLKTIVTTNRKLTWYAGQDYGELYDLEHDPREKINQWDNPAYAAEKARLLGQLLSMMEPLEKRAPRYTYA